MFKPLALAVVAGLLFSVGCKKQDPDERAMSKIPTVAPEVAKNPDAVLEHLQYAIVRKDPKHLESFCPGNKTWADGGTQWFHSHAGDMGLLLTAEEIDTLGIQNFVQKGYLSDRWTRREFNRILKELDQGKRQDIEPGMEKVDQSKLDMPTHHYASPDMNKKAADDLNKRVDAMNNQLLETIATNPKAIYAAGLYRLLKAIPLQGWPWVTFTKHSNPNKNLSDLILSVDGEELATVVVGANPDGLMFISYVQVKKYPEAIKRMFAKPEEADKEKEDAGS
jgi:hypothetical protein